MIFLLTEGVADFILSPSVGEGTYLLLKKGGSFWYLIRHYYVATNALSQSDVSVAQKARDVRWKIKQFHREAKQLTGLEKYQCRLPRIVCNHITAAFLVWAHLIRQAYEKGQTLYQVKHGLLSEYLCQQLKSPTSIIGAA